MIVLASSGVLRSRPAGLGSARVLAIAAIVVAMIAVFYIAYPWSAPQGGPSTQTTTGSPPPLMLGHKMVYDSVGSQIILFGGSLQSKGLTLYGDTWSLKVNEASWTKLTIYGSPTPRFDPGFAYDSDTRKIVLFGGYTASGRVKDTWVYDVAANSWSSVSPPTGPSERSDSPMTYDSVNKKVILFGGYLNSDTPSGETWAYDVPSNTWTKMSPEGSPPARYNGVMVYDTYSKRILLFGGHVNRGGYENEIWAYDYAGDRWEKLVTQNKPPARYCHAMTYDPESNNVILFGGGGGTGETTYDDTWIYSCRNGSWTSVSSTMHPEGRSMACMAYDSSSGKAVLFGGALLSHSGGFVYYPETWALSGDGQWTILVS